MPLENMSHSRPQEAGLGLKPGESQSAAGVNRPWAPGPWSEAEDAETFSPRAGRRFAVAHQGAESSGTCQGTEPLSRESVAARVLELLSQPTTVIAVILAGEILRRPEERWA